MLDDIDKTRFRGQQVGVVTGGSSSERQISLQTGRGFADVLDRRGYDVEVYDVPADLGRLASQRPAAVLLGVHGGAGENGVLQGYLEALGIPYTGSGVLGSALGMDKGRTKAVLRDDQVPVPAGVRLSGTGPLALDSLRGRIAEAQLAFPLVVKPNDEGSSVGVHLCRNDAEFGEALESLWGRQVSEGTPAILVEACLEGPEYTVGFFGRTCLGSIEIRPPETFYDFTAKYQSAETGYELVGDGALKMRLESLGRDAYNAVGCRGVARVDLKAVDGRDDASLCVLEVNTIPGMTATSLVPKLASSRGLDFADLTEYMLAAAGCQVAWQ